MLYPMPNRKCECAQSKVIGKAVVVALVVVVVVRPTAQGCAFLQWLRSAGGKCAFIVFWLPQSYEGGAKGNREFAHSRMMLDACGMSDYMVNANESMRYVRELWGDAGKAGSACLRAASTKGVE